MGNVGQGTGHLLDVVERLAHAHEDDVRRLLPYLFHHPIQLLDDFASSQVATES